MVLKIDEDWFGEVFDPLTREKEIIRRFTFTNHSDNGVCTARIQVITLGATITSFKIPDKCGRLDDIVLGYDDVCGYQSKLNPYFGCTIGRVCNRIANGSFELNGETINVTRNAELDHLHGGEVGFDKMIWKVLYVRASDCSLILRHLSKDGDQGYPGDLTTTVSFTLTPDNRFHINFTAVTNKLTVVNLTNHSYFNLAGHGSGFEELYEHKILIKADKMTVTDERSIPTGEIRTVMLTQYDLRKLEKIGPKIKCLCMAFGFDDNYCVELENGKTTTIAKVFHEKTGRWLEVASDQPGVQFYTANYLPDICNNDYPIYGKCNAKYTKHGAFCLETQKYPDAVHYKNFPSIQLKPGEAYTHELIYSFGVCGDCYNSRR